MRRKSISTVIYHIFHLVLYVSVCVCMYVCVRACVRAPVLVHNIFIMSLFILLQILVDHCAPKRKKRELYLLLPRGDLRVYSDTPERVLRVASERISVDPWIRSSLIASFSLTEATYGDFTI